MTSRQRVCVCVIGPAPTTSIEALARSGEAQLMFEDTGASLGALAGRALAACEGDRHVALVHGAAPPLAGDWLVALAAATKEPLAAAAVALTIDGVKPGTLDLDAPAPPRVQASASPVILLRHDGLTLTGPPDPALTEWADVVTDIIQRVVLAGLVVVAAADVVAPSDGTPAATYPWLEDVIAEAALPASPVSRARALARRADLGLSVTLDCRTLGPLRMGTQSHALGLALALGRRDDLRLRCLVAHDLDPAVAALLSECEHTTLLTYEDALAPQQQTAIVHRPQQVNTMHDLALLQPLGERLVVTHQDLIGYRNPSYHEGVETWLRHRRDTRYALELADRVLFLSDYARADALSEDLVDPAWTDVVGIGVDLATPGPAVRPTALPEQVERGAGFLLYLGTDLRHKNRPFALLLLNELRARGWAGGLVLAGADQPIGGTRREEDAMVRAIPEVAEHIHRLGVVAEQEKAWLLAHAAAVVYPTVDEGFGLLPFEAAAAGTPVAHAGCGALAEVLGEEQTLLVPWDPEASVDRVLGVLGDAQLRQRHIEAVRAAADRYTWQQTTQRTVAAYEMAIRSPRRAIGWHALDRLATEAELADLRGHVVGLEGEVEVLRAFRAAVGEDGARLVGQHALLPPGDRRALLAVLARPALRRAFLALLRAGYRVGRNR